MSDGDSNSERYGEMIENLLATSLEDLPHWLLFDDRWGNR